MWGRARPQAEDTTTLSDDGGAVVVNVPGYSVTLIHDELEVSPEVELASDGTPLGWSVDSTVKLDQELIKAFFDISDLSWPAPNDFGPWVLRVVYDADAGRRAIASGAFNMDAHAKPYDYVAGAQPEKHFVVARTKHTESATDEGATLNEDANWVIYSDNNCEQLIAHIRFLPSEEKTLNALLRDVWATGRMLCVDDFLERNGVRLE